MNTRIDRRSGWNLEIAQAINDAGQIAGTGRHHGRTRAFLLTPIEGADRANIAGAARRPRESP